MIDWGPTFPATAYTSINCSNLQPMYTTTIFLPERKPQTEVEKAIARWKKRAEVIAQSRALSIAEPPLRLLRPQRPGPVSRESTFRCRGARR